MICAPSCLTVFQDDHCLEEYCMRARSTCLTIIFSFILSLCLWFRCAHAHFGVILPSEDVVEGAPPREITVSCQFMHPFAQDFMEMVRPNGFGVALNGERRDLTGSLKAKSKGGHTVWEATVPINRPGDHVFFMIPAPYWEPVEETFIQHVTKVVVDAYGKEEGWNDPVGLRAEIVPLTRPYGLWAGNVFTGKVLFEGKPMPDIPVEVEYYNDGKRLQTPCSPCETQVVMTDPDGCFSFAMPKAGWWGFAALIEAPDRIVREGKGYPLELGAVMWVRTRDVR